MREDKCRNRARLQMAFQRLWAGVALRECDVGPKSRHWEWNRNFVIEIEIVSGATETGRNQIDGRVNTPSKRSPRRAPSQQRTQWQSTLSAISLQGYPPVCDGPDCKSNRPDLTHPTDDKIGYLSLSLWNLTTCGHGAFCRGRFLPSHSSSAGRQAESATSPPTPPRRAFHCPLS